MRSLVLAILLFTLLFQFEAISLAATPCVDLNSPQAVVTCALERHPEIQEKQIGVKKAEFESQRATQWLNPELEGESTWGKVTDQSVSTMEAKLLQPIELGGRRSARRAASENREAIANLDHLSARERVKIETVLNLYRLRHLNQEIGAAAEALETFSKVQEQFRRRPKLPPEQEISSDVFNLASGDYLLRKSRLQSQFETLKAQLELAVGQKIIAVEKILPPAKTDWPNVSATNDVSKSLNANLLSKQLELARSEADLATSEAWPELKVGPIISVESQGSQRNQFIGVGLNMTLPVFNQQGGARGAALEESRIAEVRQKSSVVALGRESERLSVSYAQLVEDLKQINKRSDILRQHKNLHRFVERGIVPASLVIESHRQLIDFTLSVNEQELLALESLWRIYSLQGRALQENF